MREILFRGKRKDILPGNEWVFGFLINHPNSSPEISYEYNEEWEDNQCEYVVPETVGQYTGMNDINGNKIQEKISINEKFLSLDESEQKSIYEMLKGLK